MKNSTCIKIVAVTTIILLITIFIVTLLTIKANEEKPNGDVQGEETINLYQALKPVTQCTITIVVDNNPNNNLVSTWGLSIFIDTPSLKILFDTGPDPRILRDNMEILGIDPRSIDVIVLSHEHGDHVGGLTFITSINPDVKIYVPRGMSESIKDSIMELNVEVIEVNRTTVIADGIVVIGEIYGPPWEQALAVYIKNKGLILIVGCSHPGILKIVEKAVNDTGIEVYMVIGGFHMASASMSECQRIVDSLINYGIEYIAPIHCSGNNIRSILAHMYSRHYIELHVGSRLYIKS